MTIAQTRLEQIINKYCIVRVIDAIAIMLKLPALAHYDETCDHEHVNTFIFTFNDDSVLKLDCDGDVYLNDDYQNAYNIFN